LLSASSGLGAYYGVPAYWWDGQQKKGTKARLMKKESYPPTTITSS